MVDAPVARVLPLVGVPHLDRLFDYAVPEKLAESAQPGVRVRIRFAGRLIDGFVIERRRKTDHVGQLRPLERVISPQIVLPPDLWELTNTLADQYAGTRGDILRSSIPSRHASAESAGLFANGAPWPELVGSLVNISEQAQQALTAAEESLSAFHHGQAYLRAVLAGRAARASLLGPPGTDLTQLSAAVASAVAWAGVNSQGHELASVLIIAPNQREVDRVIEHLRVHMSAAQITELTASVGPAARYRRYLSILEGQARVVVGTRAAAFAPMQNLRLMILLGESDDSLVDPRAPYLHTRSILRARAEQSGAALLIPHVHRSAEIQQWVEEGFAHPLKPEPDVLNAALPWIRGLGETDFDVERELHNAGARIPTMGFEAIRRALDDDLPVLVQVPRRGYAPALACSRCRTSARCRRCHGPLELSEAQDPNAPITPRCRWCGHTDGHFTCTTCGNHAVRMNVVGQDRTVEELGRAFPGVPVLASGGAHVRDHVDARKSIIVSTPSAEPIVTNSLYGAALILDPWIVLNRADLRAQEHALRQWMDAAALVRPREQGGQVIVAADSSLLPVQHLIRWDPTGAAQRELQSRREAMFPPAAALAAIDGTSTSINSLLESWEQPDGVELLGPVELPAGIRLPAGLDQHQAAEARRLIARVPAAAAQEFGRSLRTAQSVRSSQSRSKGTSNALRVVVDPVRIG